MIQPLLQAADLRGAAQLTTDAVAGLTSLVEAMHARIARLPRLESVAPAAEDERASGVTGLVYKTVRGVTRVVGGGVDALFAWLGPALAPAGAGAGAGGLPSAEREAIVAALNGVVGDHLAATHNPLAIPMSFRSGGRALVLDRSTMRVVLPAARPRVLLLLHGLCMSDLQWLRDGHDHGAALARDLGYTPVYLHYNSGLAVSTNGRVLAQQLERLLDAWPVPVERLVLLGHSMGGLVARSALFHGMQAQRSGPRWPGRVDDLVCLGTPHQGAPLEHAGQCLDLLLAATPYAAPLARLGRMRSAGINDLRHGDVVSPDVAGRGAHLRAHAPLPDTVRCHAVAASLGPAGGDLKGRLLGDGLVPVASALGNHREPARRLAFDADRRAVVHDTGHLDLLSSAAVYEHLKRWLR